MEAKHILQTGRNDLYYARKKTDTWPGYHESNPLGKKGYWYGTTMVHKHIGVSKDEVIFFLGSEIKERIEK